MDSRSYTQVDLNRLDIAWDVDILMRKLGLIGFYRDYAIDAFYRACRAYVAGEIEGVD